MSLQVYSRRVAWNGIYDDGGRRFFPLCRIERKKDHVGTFGGYWIEGSTRTVWIKVSFVFIEDSCRKELHGNI